MQKLVWKNLFIQLFVQSLVSLDYDDVINDENSSRGSLNDRVTAHVNEFLKRWKLWY